MQTSARIPMLDLSTRTSRLLAKVDLGFVDQLQSATDQKLYIIPGCGNTALADVRRAVAKHEREVDRRCEA